METLIKRQLEARKHIDEIVRLNPDVGTMLWALKIQKHLKLPMSVVLDKLWPGMTVLDKCAKLGIARATYYSWLNGSRRPDDKLAGKLAKLTGFDKDAIRGRMPAQG